MFPLWGARSPIKLAQGIGHGRFWADAPSINMDAQIGEKEIYNHGEQFENVDNNSSTTTSNNNIDNTNKKILKGLNVAEPRPLLKQMGHLRRFELLETPFCIYLKAYLSDDKLLNNKNDDKTPYNLEKKMLEKYFYIGFIILCMFSLVVNAVRCFVIDEKDIALIHVTNNVNDFQNNSNATLVLQNYTLII